MAILNLKSFAKLVEDSAAAVQSRATALIDFTTGSILRSWIESVAAVGMWLQGLVLYVLSLTRLSTSQGTDVDSFIDDFGVVRLSSSLASGSVTFSRFTDTSAGLVPIGTTVRTLDGTQTFTVALDAGNSHYSSSQNGYILPIGVDQITVPVVANIPGPGANVAAGTIGLITSSTPGVDTVNNAVALTGGASAETDQQAKSRFVTFIASLSKATEIAIKYAVQSLQFGAAAEIIENTDPAGNTVYGFFIVVVDDGTGVPSQAMLDNAAAAVENTRAVGVRYAIFPPIVLGASISFAVKVAPGYDQNTVAGAAGDAVVAYVNSLALGQSLPYTKIAQVAYESNPGAIGIENVLLNNDTQDLVATKMNVIKIGTIAVSIIP